MERSDNSDTDEEKVNLATPGVMEKYQAAGKIANGIPFKRRQT